MYRYICMHIHASYSMHTHWCIYGCTYKYPYGNIWKCTCIHIHIRHVLFTYVYIHTKKCICKRKCIPKIVHVHISIQTHTSVYHEYKYTNRSIPEIARNRGDVWAMCCLPDNLHMWVCVCVSVCMFEGARVVWFHEMRIQIYAPLTAQPKVCHVILKTSWPLGSEDKDNTTWSVKDHDMVRQRRPESVRSQKYVMTCHMIKKL